MRYFLCLAYNGNEFFGWQRQPKHLSVQETLETAIKNILKQDIKITGCGRTDSGVHARIYYAHFDFSELSYEDINHLKYRLNRHFSYNINILDIFKVKDNAHARFDAINRTYKYYISQVKQPFNNDFSNFISRPLDMDNMNKAAEKLLQYKDFTSFSKIHTQVNNNLCEIYKSRWNKEGDFLVFTIQANRFLRNMVRSIVGTLLELGLGRIDEKDFCEIIEAKDRGRAGISVSAKALFLYDIEYPREIFLD